jgi:metallo-beta-lactamase family protein
VTIHGEKVAVRADIKNIEAFSAHADQAGLMSWLKNITKRPQKVILVHGEEKSQAVLADLINKELGLPVVIPNWLDEVELIPAEMVQAVAQAGPDKTSFNLAMQAEQLYLKVRTKLLDLFNEDYNNSRYNELIEKLKNIDAQL